MCFRFRLLFVWLCNLFVGRGATPAMAGTNDDEAGPSGLQPAVDPTVVQDQPTEVDMADVVDPLHRPCRPQWADPGQL